MWTISMAAPPRRGAYRAPPWRATVYRKRTRGNFNGETMLMLSQRQELEAPGFRRRVLVRRFATVAFAVALTCVSGLMGSGDAHAQDPMVVVTFDEAVELALERATPLRRARADVRLQDVLATRERIDFLPQLTLSSRGRRTFGRSFSQEEGAILSQTNDFFDAGLSASVNLFDGFEKFASMEEASLREDASRLRLERVREDVVFQVVQGFTSLVVDRELATAREQELVAAGELLEEVQRLVEVGRQPVSDRYQQEATVAEAEAALVEAQRQVALSETTLMQLLRLDPARDYDFRTSPLTTIDTLPEPDTYSYEALLGVALARRADLTAARSSLDATGQNIRSARSGYWPSIDLSFNYGSNWSANSRQAIPGTGTDPRVITITPDGGGSPVTFEVPGTGSSPAFTTPSFVDQLDGRRGGSVSLSVSVPVFDRLQTWASIEQAQADRLNARYDLEELRQDIGLQIRQALLDYESAVAQQRASAKRLEASERALDAAQRRYELGAAGFVELVQARSALVSARSAEIGARYNVVLARRLIDYHTGGLDPDAPVTGEGSR